jgi:hypothetical protein
MAVTRGQSRGTTRVIWVAIHTNEGNNPPDLLPDRTAENLAAWLDREIQAKRFKSYHRITDDDSVMVHCPDELAAWSLRNGNNRSLNLCFTGWARWTRGDWLAHYGMLTRGAVVVAQWCRDYQIPVRHLTPAQVEASQSGIIGHGDYTLGTGDGTHTDPGIGFPWDVFVSLVDNAGSGEDELSAETERLIKEIAPMVRTIHHEMTLWLPERIDYRYLGEPEPKIADRSKDTVVGRASSADARAYEARRTALRAVEEVQGLRRDLPGMIADVVRAVLGEQRSL